MSSNGAIPTSSKASSLLASLTGEDEAVEPGTGSTTVPQKQGETDEDLFGEIPIDDPTSPSKSSGLADSGLLPPENNDDATSGSLLASSGLLAGTSGHGGGGSGLFDEVDELERKQEEEERRRQELEEQRRHQEEQARQLAQQQAAQQQADAAAAAAAQQQSLQQQAAQQQAAQQQQGHISTPVVPPTGLMQDMTLQRQHQQQLPLDSPTQGGFYRNHQPQAAAPAATDGTYYYSSAGGAVQTHTIAPSAVGRYQSQTPYQATQPSVLAGLHNSGSSPNGSRPMPIVKAPADFQPIYGKVKVSDPLLTQGNAMFGFASPPHWSYQVQTELKADLGGFWIVRRRFRHVVALEERLREDCPGAILPPRPDKHATRALEEASTSQTAEFALQRAAELEQYLNALVQHPIAGQSNIVRLFLALQDDVGTAWPEVSSNMITRISAVTAGAAVQLADTTADAADHLPWSHSEESGEDNAELLALASSEGLRMGAVTQAVPKLEGAITLIREQGERGGAVGLELGKLSKDVEGSDRELSMSLEVLSNGLLRHGRRTKRLAVELSAALAPYATQYKLCRYEKMAFNDRRSALAKRQKERSKADARAQKLVIMQRSLQGVGNAGELERMEMEASASDEQAVDAVKECEEIGERLKTEVNRVAYLRRTEWSKSMKVIASAMKEATAERVAIWESTREAFLQAFPDYSDASAGGSSVASAPVSSMT